MPEDHDLFARRMAEKQASRDADDDAIRRGRKSVAEVAAESEAFARALAAMADRDLASELRIVIDPHEPLVL